jgi:hypothetical protein
MTLLHNMRVKNKRAVKHLQLVAVPQTRITTHKQHVNIPRKPYPDHDPATQQAHGPQKTSMLLSTCSSWLFLDQNIYWLGSYTDYTSACLH